MKDITELIETKKRYRTALVQKRFDSKKNTVAYVLLNGKPRILKWYPPGLITNFQTEYSILKQGESSLNIPSVFAKDEKNNVLILSYIVGINLCDLINDLEQPLKDKDNLIKILGMWFFHFHHHFHSHDEFMIRGDAILRNFIFTDRIWGVDFEEARRGQPIEDIARMCASILSTDPMFTEEKIHLCQLFIHTYHQQAPWSLSNINDEVAYALLQQIQWRPEQEEILRTNAIRIRKKQYLNLINGHNF